MNVPVVGVVVVDDVAIEEAVEGHSIAEEMVDARILEVDGVGLPKGLVVLIDGSHHSIDHLCSESLVEDLSDLLASGLLTRVFNEIGHGSNVHTSLLYMDMIQFYLQYWSIEWRDMVAVGSEGLVCLTSSMNCLLLQ